MNPTDAEKLDGLKTADHTITKGAVEPFIRINDHRSGAFISFYPHDLVALCRAVVERVDGKSNLCEKLIRWVKKHHWDNLEKDKDLILRHLRTFTGDEPVEVGGRVPEPGTTEITTHCLQFIAKMLHESVVNQNNKADFHICEAWEIAKKYYKEDGIATVTRNKKEASHENK